MSAKPMAVAMAEPCECSANRETREAVASLSQDESARILQRIARVSPASITTRGQLMEVIGNEKLLMAAANDAGFEFDVDAPEGKVDWKRVLRVVGDNIHIIASAIH